MSAVVIRGDARALPLPDASVDLIVTSPPFFGLRDYRDAGESLAGQIGSEATPGEYIAALLDCTREWMRVLKPSGSLFVELGDKYQATAFDPAQRRKDTPGVKRPAALISCERCGTKFTGGPGRRFCSSYCGGSDNSPRSTRQFVPNKCLLDLPHRYAIRCVDDLGLIKRAEIIWHHVNGLPESVTDRVRRAHSAVFHFTLQPRYYSAVDEVREEQVGLPASHYGRIKYKRRPDPAGMARTKEPAPVGSPREYNPLGKLPGSVWSIPSQPLIVPPHLGVDHFAAFPMELPRRVISGWSPPGICTACGQGRRPVVGKGEPLIIEQTNPRRLSTGQPGNGTVGFRYTPSGQVWNAWKALHPDVVTSYACACPAPDAPTRPSVIVDPFGGTGTTALVAEMLGRHGISIDRSADYSRLARWRVTDPAERARALGVPKPPPVPDGQGALFDSLEAS